MTTIANQVANVLTLLLQYKKVIYSPETLKAVNVQLIIVISNDTVDWEHYYLFSVNGFKGFRIQFLTPQFKLHPILIFIFSFIWF